jgi:hypothetical protein
MVDKEDMIETFEDLYANLKMEIMTNNADIKNIRQQFGQIQGFFLAMRMTVPLDMDEIQYVEHRLRMLEEKLL